MKAETFRYARPRLMAAAVGAWMLIAGPATARAEARRDPKAVAVADAVEEAIAPGGAWGKIAGLKFSFTVVREGKPLKSFEHVWDTRSPKA